MRLGVACRVAVRAKALRELNTVKTNHAGLLARAVARCAVFERAWGPRYG